MEHLGDPELGGVGPLELLLEVDSGAHLAQHGSLEDEAVSFPAGELGSDVPVGDDDVVGHHPAGADPVEARVVVQIDPADGEDRRPQPLPGLLQPGLPGIGLQGREVEVVVLDEQHRPAHHQNDGLEAEVEWPVRRVLDHRTGSVDADSARQNELGLELAGRRIGRSLRRAFSEMLRKSGVCTDPGEDLFLECFVSVDGVQSVQSAHGVLLNPPNATIVRRIH